MQIKKTAKQIAISTAKTATHEISETLKSARNQIIEPIPEKKPEEKAPPVNIDKTKLHNQGIRQMQALETEIKDIQNLKLQKEKERLASPPPEEKNLAPVPEVQSKKGRRMAGAVKKVKSTVLNIIRRQGNVEMRQPPSS
jgi:type IV secretory pathway VirJ component